MAGQSLYENEVPCLGLVPLTTAFRVPRSCDLGSFSKGDDPSSGKEDMLFTRSTVYFSRDALSNVLYSTVVVSVDAENYRGTSIGLAASQIATSVYFRTIPYTASTMITAVGSQESSCSQDEKKAPVACNGLDAVHPSSRDYID